MAAILGIRTSDSLCCPYTSHKSFSSIRRMVREEMLEEFQNGHNGDYLR